MRLFVLTGAGLSAPSGIPCYNDIKSTPDYSDFFDNDAETAKKSVDKLLPLLLSKKPNEVHKEFVVLEQYCSIFNIEYHHFTLNVDNLLEQAGGNATHIYGCVDDVKDLVESRFEQKHDFTAQNFREGDVVIIVGVSSRGVPVSLFGFESLPSWRSDVKL